MLSPTIRAIVAESTKQAKATSILKSYFNVNYNTEIFRMTTAKCVKIRIFKNLPSKQTKNQQPIKQERTVSSTSHSSRLWYEMSKNRY
ncbi:hypothetical protein DASC09_054910 [Saccharomycopsis crataegensis]|uniref:Uncharacterized protein n=1 Tax=Saccharomycopsis crataegensis TaxID=43959 RepID=A0AAV5QUS7_9ASCO|nr:hypothetical protein DASC09_054910 [Saccharomycopsis crataegensis]